MDLNVAIDSIVVASRNQVSCPLQDEVAILDLAAGVYYSLDPVGARVWELLAAPRSVGAIRDALVAEYDVEPARCERDLLELLRDLARAGLVEIRDGRPP